jgi:predicted transcriptional regulator
LISTAVTALCQSIPSEEKLASLYYTKLSAQLTANPQAEKLFQNTLAYINNPNEKSAFLAGGQSCVQYFVGLQAAFLVDLQAAGLSAQAAAAAITQYIQNAIAAANQG